jgi:hypothetical protein
MDGVGLSAFCPCPRADRPQLTPRSGAEKAHFMGVTWEGLALLPPLASLENHCTRKGTGGFESLSLRQIVLTGPNRRAGQHGSATCRLRLDQQLATYQLQAFFHAGQTESRPSTRRIDIEAHAFITNG